MRWITLHTKSVYHHYHYYYDNYLAHIAAGLALCDWFHFQLFPRVLLVSTLWQWMPRMVTGRRKERQRFFMVNESSKELLASIHAEGCSHSQPHHWHMTNPERNVVVRTKLWTNNTYIPLPQDRHRLRRVACEDHVVALRQDEPLRPNVHLVLQRHLVLAQVDPGKDWNVNFIGFNPI